MDKNTKAGDIKLGDIFRFPIETPGQLLSECGKAILIFMIASANKRERNQKEVF